LRKASLISTFPIALLILFAVGSAVFLVHPGAGLAQQKAVVGSRPEAVYKYETPGVQLEGTLIERKVYGPPGYGETPAKDLRTSILVLKLWQPITVEPMPHVSKDNPNGDKFHHVREVQLIVNPSQRADVRKLAGRTIAATGTLSESITASQYTRVWLDAKRLEPK
jgi:hypothetical protein